MFNPNKIRGGAAALEAAWEHEMRRVDRECERNAPQTCRMMLEWCDSIEKRGFQDRKEEKKIRLYRLSALVKMVEKERAALKAMEKRG